MTSPGNRGTSRRTVLAASLAVAVGLGLTGCGSRPSEKAAAPTGKPIVIGISLPLTGDFS